MHRAPAVGMGCKRPTVRTNRVVGPRLIAPFNRLVLGRRYDRAAGGSPRSQLRLRPCSERPTPGAPSAALRSAPLRGSRATPPRPRSAPGPLRRPRALSGPGPAGCAALRSAWRAQSGHPTPPARPAA
jgi:hypothetical protein